MFQDINLGHIERATELIANGSLQSLGEGQFQIDTADLIEPIVITVNSCRCAEFVINQIRCEHIWAAIGATTAMLLSEIEETASLSDLENIGRKQKDALKPLPDAYASIIRSEYSSRHCALTGNGEGRASHPPCLLTSTRIGA